MIKKPESSKDVDLFFDEQRLFNLNQCLDAQGTALRLLLDEDALKVFLLYVDYMKEAAKLERKISFEKGFRAAKNEDTTPTDTP